MQFSLVVPLYNKAPYVAQSLRSLLAQTVDDLEIIVVDDGSTDDGAAVVAALAATDPRIRLVRQANGGVSAARNRGISEARGAWIGFLDADDWLHPEFLAHMRALAAQHPDAQIVAGGFRMVDHADGWAPEPWPLAAAPRIELIRDLPTRWRRPAFCTGTVVFRRDVLLALMPAFPPRENLGEDLDLWFRAAERTPVVFVDLPFLCYRTAVPDSLMKAHGAPVLLPYQHRMRERVQNGITPRALVRPTLRYLAESHVTLARRELKARRRLGALRQLGLGWRAASGHRWWYTLAMLAGAPAR